MMDWYTSEKTMYVRQNEIAAEIQQIKQAELARHQDETGLALALEAKAPRISPFTRLLTVLRLRSA